MYLPHRIPHDFKHQSRGDFENRLKKPTPSRGSALEKGSILSDTDSTLIGSSKGSEKSDGSKDEKPTKPDWYPYPIPPPETPKKRRRLCLLWLIPVVCLLIALPVATVVLVKRHDSAGGALGNSTITSTATVFTSMAMITTTITQGESTVTVVTTQQASTATVVLSSNPTTTTVSSQPTATQPAKIQGFDAYGFYNGDLMLVYEYDGSIWTKQYQGSWNSPTLIASGAKSGTSVRLWAWVQTENSYDNYDYYGPPTATGLTYWSVVYIDNNSTLQQQFMALDSSGWTQEYDASLPPMTGNWYAGTLGSSGYEWQVSDTMYFEVCAWGPLLQSETEASGYLYFDNADGGITKLGANLNDWWTIADLPDPVAGSNKAVTCAGRGDQIENLWLINENGLLEQWWLNATAVNENEYYNSSYEWNQGTHYTGLVSPNSSIETWSTPLSDIIFYQAPNDSVMYFNVLGECSSTSISSSGFISVADPGTRLTTSLSASVQPSIANYENATFDNFYVYFQNGTDLTKEMMLPNPETGVTVTGTSGGQIVMSGGASSLGSVPSLGSNCRNVLWVLSFGTVIWLLL